MKTVGIYYKFGRYKIQIAYNREIWKFKFYRLCNFFVVGIYIIENSHIVLSFHEKSNPRRIGMK